MLGHLPLHQQDIRVEYQEKFLHWNRGQASEQAAQGRGAWKYSKNENMWHFVVWFSGLRGVG